MSTIDDLRSELLGALKDLRRADNPMEPDRARAIAQVAGVIVESAKVEVDFLRVTGKDDSNFIKPNQPAALPKPGEVMPGVTTRTHRMRG